MKYLFLFLLILVPYGAIAEKLSRDEVLDTFSKYIKLNTDFIESLNKADRQQKRMLVEKYFDKLEGALNSAKYSVCNLQDPEVADALFILIYETLNSASEYPSQILGEVYICQPRVMLASFRRLSDLQQKAIGDVFMFGFENAAYTSPLVDNIAKLRRDLQSHLGAQ